ncbi:MMPL family transporter [Methylotuvimicrobium alcaliphilum]|uniref:Membrane protein n=1 Tax=Methylotuvimicrobium alcaliphilum (strain DSM 19304 / NCIMB 14124 / VKM B-2133 / 20Z) TaxID=1091494 RepID=G4SXG2_META2|nr:MMPL family transporter [Methylotuvimicrobium alcaliphilum]CCE25326.1 putative Membrane protein [Methylotuvimicrobium alcaliphilum 20Z]
MPNRRNSLFYLLPPLLALLVALTVEFKTDLSAFIIAGDNAEELLLASEMQSGALSRRYLISVGSDTGEPVSGAFIIALQDRLNAIDGVLEVWSPERQNQNIEAVQALYRDYAGALYSLKPEQDLAELFTPQGLAQRAEFLKRALLSPQGAMVKSIALQDPLLLTLNGFRTVGAQMQQAGITNTQYRNLILETEMAGLDAPQQSRIQAAIEQAFKELMHDRPESWRLEMTGVPVFAAATQQLIQGDIVQISILSSLALMALFLLLFRSFGALLQVFTLLIIVILSAILTTAWVFGYVHGMTIAIGSTLIGICIDYPIHAIAHAQTVRAEDKTAAIIRIWPSLLLGGITTLVGYAALGASGYPGFQQIAVYAGTGIIAALLLTRFILPGLVADGDRRTLTVPLVARWANFCARFRPWLLTVLLVLLASSLFALPSLRWLEDMQDLTPELDYLKENDKRIRARMVSIEPGRFLLITGQDIETALQKAEQVYPVLDRLKQQGDLNEYFGLYPWLLSTRQQELNQALLQDHLTDANRQLWQQALREQGLSVERLGRFDYPKQDALTLEQVFETPVKRLIDSRIISTERQSVVMIWLAEHEPEALRAALATIEDARYFSQRDMLNDMTRDYTERAQTLLAAGLFIIVLLLAVRYRSLVKTLQTLLPAVLAALFILSLWSLGGAAISFLHLVGFLLVVAICVDYGIFYQENRGGDIKLTYQAMAASMSTSALAFGCLGTAESTSLRILAGVVVLGVLLGFLFCPLIIKHREDA